MKWEYKIVKNSTLALTDDWLSVLGNLEWELVSISDNIAYFKRPKETIGSDIEKAHKMVRPAVDGYFGGKIG